MAESAEQRRQRAVKALGSIKGLHPEMQKHFKKHFVTATAKTESISMEKYRSNSLEFVRERLGETVPECLVPVFDSFDKHEVTVVISANGVGKTWAGGRMAAAAYLCEFKPQVFVTAAAPLTNIRDLLWKEITEVYMTNPNLFATDRRLGSMMIAPKDSYTHKADDDNDGKRENNGQRLISALSIPTVGGPEVREAKFSGKHAPYQAFICDEGDAIPVECYKGINACQTGEKNRIVIFFNPRFASGYVYKLIQEKRANVIKITAFDHPNVMTGENLFPGAVTRAKTIQRINDWSRPLAKGEDHDHECYEVPEFLIGETAKISGTDKMYDPLPNIPRRITNNEFYYKVLARFPASSEQQLISRVWINRAFKNHKELTETGAVTEKDLANETPINGYDVAEMGRDYNIIYSRYGSFVAVPVRWKCEDPLDNAKEAQKLHQQTNAKSTNVDAIGIGSKIAPQLRAWGEEASSVLVSQVAYDQQTFCTLRDELAWRVREWLRTDKNAALPYSEFLEQQLLRWEYKHNPLRQNRIQITSTDDMKKHLMGKSPDDFWAIAMTFANIEKRFIPQYNPKIHNINHFNWRDINRGWNFFGALSYSSITRSTFLFCCIDPKKNIYILDEHSEVWEGVEPIIRFIEQKKSEHKIRFSGFFAGDEIFISKAKRRQLRSDDSISREFSSRGIYFKKVEGNVTSAWAAVRNRFRKKSTTTDENQETLLIFNEHCPNLIRKLPETKYNPTTSARNKETQEDIDDRMGVTPVIALKNLVMHVDHRRIVKPEKEDNWKVQFEGAPSRTSSGIRFSGNDSDSIFPSGMRKNSNLIRFS